MRLNVNDEDVEVDVDPDTPLLWVLRDHLNLTGTKYGCGIGACGACTVLMNGHPIRSCSTTAEASKGYNIQTIEGLSENASHPVQQAWIEGDVPQCGYCQSGMIMTAVALLNEKANPTDEEINDAMTNICRCGTYSRIRAAIRKVAQERAAS
ncbi:MAG: (2Fe-2S)-binding protein [Pseudomonadales bacterium]|jgi:isoquinoline 1-oxidoreductase alpha subunit|nr:(2Fe-2S)-binding protein [Pseudomonadales bacterium]